MFSQGPLHDVSPEIAALFCGLRQGDSEAWRTVTAAFRQRLRDLAAAKLPAEIACRADASDIVQQTLAEANESFAAFNGNSLPELFVWLAAILNHNVSDAVRQHLLAERRTVKVECHSDDSSPDDTGWKDVFAADQTSPSMACSRGEAQVRLRVAIEGLPPRQCKAVRLRHLEGRSLANVAVELGCTVPAAAATIARGLRALRIKLQDLG